MTAACFLFMVTPPHHSCLKLAAVVVLKILNVHIRPEELTGNSWCYDLLWLHVGVKVKHDDMTLMTELTMQGLIITLLWRREPFFFLNFPLVNYTERLLLFCMCALVWLNDQGKQNSLPDLNPNGVHFLDFCARHRLSITTTMFKHRGL